MPGQIIVVLDFARCFPGTGAEIEWNSWDAYIKENRNGQIEVLEEESAARASERAVFPKVLAQECVIVR